MFVWARVNQKQQVALLDILIVLYTQLNDVAAGMRSNADEIRPEGGIVRLRACVMRPRRDDGDDHKGDTTTIDLCLSLFPWAHFRSTKSAVKMHTLLDLRGNIPTFIRVTTGDVHDVNILDEIIPQPGAYYVMDRGYLDYARLYRIHLSSAFFVTRAKRNLDASRIYSQQVDKQTGILADQSIALNGYDSRKDYPGHLRRIRYRDSDTGKDLVFLTNQFMLPAATICALYKSRWQVELFFKWIKQHLRIKAFFGSSENAVKTQIWIAVSVYLLVAIVKKKLELPGSLYTLLQVLSVTLFEKMPISQALQQKHYTSQLTPNSNQLILFDF